jgi:putative ABC transport system permease protein
MSLLATMRLALSRILATKTRSFLTMLGVVIGVASLVALTSIASGATSGINSSLASLGANTISIAGTSNTALTQDDATAIGKLQHVKRISYAVSGTGTGVNGTTTASLALTGESSGYSAIAQPDIAVGTFLPNFPGAAATRSVVLSASAANALSVTPAEVGATVTVDGLPFTVSGVLNDASGFARSGVAYVSLQTARALFAQFPYVSSITVQADDSADVNSVLAASNSLLRARYGLGTTGTAQFTVTNQASLLSSLASIQSLLSLLLGAIASISLVVGGIGIMNIMLVSVRERTREIGVRRAIGAKQGQILTQFLIEAIVLSVVGGILGLILGLGVSAIIAGVAGWAFTISGSTIALALGFSAGVGVVFGVWPARAASRLQPVEALRFE